MPDSGSERAFYDERSYPEPGLEDVPTLGESFDVIIVTGVVHPLPDPVRGLVPAAAASSPLSDRGER